MEEQKDQEAVKKLIKHLENPQAPPGPIPQVTKEDEKIAGQIDKAVEKIAQDPGAGQDKQS